MRPPRSPSRSTAVLRLALATALALNAGVAGRAPAEAQAASCSRGPEELTVDLGVAGDGTAESPFLIATAAQLQEVADSYHQTCAFRQVAHIDLQDLDDDPSDGTPYLFSSIGSSSDPFTGSYDGQRYRIEGLRVSGSLSEGLFGAVGDGATIERVRIVDGVVSGSSSSAKELGGLIGRVGINSGTRGAATTIRDVVISVDVVDGSGVGGSNSFGGLVGYVDRSALLTIEDSAAYGDVSGARYGLGGLIGYLHRSADVTITGSYAAGDVTGSASSGSINGIGGIIGLVGSTGGAPVITDSSASGSVSVAPTGTATVATATIGCVVGDRQSATVTRTYSTGTLTDGTNPTAQCAALTSAPTGFVAGVGFKRPEEYAPIGSGDSGGGDEGGGSGPSYVTTSTGTPPAPPTGTGEWQQEDGSVVSLRVSSPAPGQVRYQTDGVVLTLTGSRGSGTGTGLVADADGNVECEVCAFLAAGGVIEAWMFSEPRLVAAWSTDEIDRVLASLPCRRFTIPVGAPLDGGVGLPPGAHTLQLVLPTTTGLQAVNVGVTVAGPVPGSIPAGEVGPVDVARTAPGAVTAAALILALTALQRRPRRSTPTAGIAH